MARNKLVYRDATTARHAYRRALQPMLGELEGDWRIEFLGNKRWLEALPKAQRVLGISKLWGMRFEGEMAWHLVGKPKRPEAVKPLLLGVGPSVVDGNPTTTMVSAPGNGRAWELFSSEVRVIDSELLLGMDLIGWGQWQVPMPFVLHRHDA